jgi:hypothetical protein
MPKVDDVLEMETPGAAPPTDPEAAADAIADLTFTDKPEADAPETLTKPAPKPKRRTKAELESEVARLTADAERAKAERVAQSPDLIAAMKRPLTLSFTSLFNVIATWRGEPWKRPAAEMEMLGEAWAPCVGPLLANHPNAVLWASAIAVTYSVAYPALQVEQQIKARQLETTDTTGKVEVPANA